MFSKLGEFIVRAWPAVLIAWISTVVFVSVIAPPLERVAKTDEFSFLPPGSSSLVSETLFRKAFPNGYTPSRVVIVARRDSGLTAEDEEFLDDGLEEQEVEVNHVARKHELRERLAEIQREPALAKGNDGSPIITGIRTFRNKNAGGNLLFDNQNAPKAVLTLVDLSTEFLDSRNRLPVGRIEALLRDKDFAEHIPAGLSLFLSGEATVGRDMIDAAKNSAKATELLTVVLVLILLGAIYRAPLMAIIPLVTVVVSVKLSMSLLIMASMRNWVVLFQGIETYVAVLMYGAGVDYCLFLIARYKEEIDSGASYDEAIANSITKVGAAIAASAGTVICGIGMMFFAQFGKFHEAGIAISFGLTIVLIASLTFTPAFLRLAGRWAFWPQMRTERVTVGWISSSSLWSSLSQVAWLHNIWDNVGKIVLRMPLRIWSICMLLMLPFAIIGVVFYTHLSYGLLSDLRSDATSVRGTRVVQEYYPAGTTGAITILIKNDGVDFSDDAAGIEYIEELTRTMLDRKKELQLFDVRSVAYPLGGGEPSVLETPAGLKRGQALKRSRDHYVSSDHFNNHVTRLEITSEVDPFSRESIAYLTWLEREIERLLPEHLRAGTDIFTSGSAASVRDLKIVTDSDQIRIDLLVVVVVFFILVILLKNVALCSYLIVTVLFSYLVALGVTFAFFSLTDPQFAGLDWKVPMFLFTILIAVGEDYNIFLMTRIEEEQLIHGRVKGVIEALSKTGRIISSCGIIMAGTFASLCGGSLKGMIQLGFALAFGVLLDTFVVRPVLVPAYLVMLHSGRFGRLGPWLGGPSPAAVPPPGPDPA